MKEHKAVLLAKEIVALDNKRDELLETLMNLAGKDAFPVAEGGAERLLSKVLLNSGRGVKANFTRP